MSGSDKSLTSPQLIFQVSPSTPSLRRLLSPARLHSSVHGHQLSTIGNETESSIRCPKGIGGDFVCSHSQLFLLFSGIIFHSIPRPTTNIDEANIDETYTWLELYANLIISSIS